MANSPWRRASSWIGTHLVDLHGVVQRHGDLPLQLGLAAGFRGGGNQHLAAAHHLLRPFRRIEFALQADVGREGPRAHAEEILVAAVFAS